MKVRKGFVSNSSSSSFVCDLTGEAFEIYDGEFGSEYGIISCVKGHTMVFEGFPAIEEYLKKAEDEFESEYEIYTEMPSEVCPICQKDPKAVSMIKERIKDLMKLVDLKPTDLE